MNYSTLPDYGLLTGLSIVTVHRGAERIHSELLNILLAFPCRMYPMDYERTVSYPDIGRHIYKLINVLLL